MLAAYGEGRAGSDIDRAVGTLGADARDTVEAALAIPGGGVAAVFCLRVFLRPVEHGNESSRGGSCSGVLQRAEDEGD